MPSNPTAAVQAAMRQYQRAPADKKPSDAELAKKHKVNASTIYRARMRLLKLREQNKDQEQPNG